MSKSLLMRAIIALIITNIATLLFWAKDNTEKVELDDGKVRIGSREAVATVNGGKITYDEWMSHLRSNYGKKQLKALIDREIVRQLAHKNNIKVDDKVIDREIYYLMTMQGVMTKDEAEQKEKEWRKDIVYRFQLEALLAKDANIPEEEIRTYYDGYHKQYDFTASMQLSHILVKDMATANKIFAELENGASFPLLAKEYSIDEDSKDSGGYLGFFTANSQFLPKKYDEVAAKMKQHTYSEPFLTDAGAAIIYLHRSLPDIQFTYDEIKPYIRNELALEKLERTLDADLLWDEADIEWVYER